MEKSPRQFQLMGLAGLLVLVLGVGFLLGVYQKAFTPVVTVDVMADRAGLLLEKGSAVRSFGVDVGEVRKIEVAPGGEVRIEIALDPDQAPLIPNNVTPGIRSTTVFGAKFVDLQVPVGPVGSPIASGDVIRASDTTVEANDVFRHAVQVLLAVKPSSLNSTLGAMSSALNGRGDKLGSFLSGVDTYLASFNNSLPALESDLARAPTVLNTYADAAPDLIATGDQLGTTSITLDQNSATLHALLIDLDRAAGITGRFLDLTEEPLLESLKQLTPVTDLLRIYSPEIGCVLDRLGEYAKRVPAYQGNVQPGVQTFAGFVPPQADYTAENLPKLIRGVGPKCYKRASPSNPKLPHKNFDDGTFGLYDFLGPDSNETAGRQSPRSAAADGLTSLFGPNAVESFLKLVAGRSKR